MLKEIGLISGFVSLTGCATAIHSPNNYIIIQPTGDELTGSSAWVNGKPSTVESLEIQSRPDHAFGRFIVTSNTDLYTMGPGVSLIPIERCGFCPEPRIEIKKVGFKTHVIHLKRRISPAFYLNALNIFGFVVDMYSGFMWKYEPDSVTVQLEQEARP